MKKIKFRAWHKEEKKMYEVVMMDFGVELWLHLGDRQIYADWNEVELLQFTGIKDKRGKEVYEGSIIEWEIDNEKVRMVVNFEDGIFGFESHPFSHIPKSFKVVGNIYENKELIGN